MVMQTQPRCARIFRVRSAGRTKRRTWLKGKGADRELFLVPALFEVIADYASPPPSVISANAGWRQCVVCAQLKLKPVLETAHGQ
jgi:hypothetical protein